MLLWDIIRDWFVMYIFGGSSSAGSTYFGGMLGRVTYWLDGGVDDVVTERLNVFTALQWTTPDGYIQTIGFADWLSTTATLIVMISVLIGLWFLVRYFFRMFAGLISGR